MAESFSVSGQIVDVVNRRLFPGTVHVVDGRISETVESTIDRSDNHFITPGLVDSHIHIESSMMPPAEFARAAMRLGTVATVSDPHEIANVLGAAGIKFMVDSASTTPMKIHFGLPSCVPATRFETSGASMEVKQLEPLAALPRICCLAEMMNYPGVIADDEVVHAKLAFAKRIGMPIDGHAPGLSGPQLQKYVAAGISTDHECFTIEEAREKLALGMKILIREGSASRNFDELVPLLADPANAAACMFCSDDKHPNDLANGHVDALVRRAIAQGTDPMIALQAASVNPVRHYRLDVGLLQPGDPADFLVVDDLRAFNVLRTYIDGHMVADSNDASSSFVAPNIINKFDSDFRSMPEFAVEQTATHVRVIDAIDGQLITGESTSPAHVVHGNVVSDPDRDVLKLVVVNRYHNTPPAIGFVRNVGLKRGAIASSVAHDSHNVVAVGVDDESICRAVNRVIEHRGGLSAVADDIDQVLSLPIAGLMSDQPYDVISKQYTMIDDTAKQMGSRLRAPFMTLAFLALPVIPDLKLTDRGLFQCSTQQFVDLMLNG